MKGSVADNVHKGAIAAYEAMLSYMGIENTGIITAAGQENGSESKLEEIKAFAKAL